MKWTCLMYHEVPDQVSGASDDYFSVPGDRFAHQMEMLAANGLVLRTMEEVAAAPGRDIVALTFDDGHESHYRNALPAMVEHSFTGTFFVVTERVGQPGYVTWHAVREMHRAGMSIQSHTATHPFLSTLSGAVLDRELRDSKARLDDALGQDTVALALPGGDAPWRRIADAAAAAGYRYVATSRVGTNASGDDQTPVTFVRRVTVRHGLSDRMVIRYAHANRLALLRAGGRAAVLSGLRRWIGVERYAAIRRRVLRFVRS